MAGLKRNIQEMYNGHQNNNNNSNLNNSNGGLMNGNGMDMNSEFSNIKSSMIMETSSNNNNTGSGTGSANEAKKTRLDNGQNNAPSRVVHLRNIPQQLNDNEICYLGLHFGLLTNVLFLRSKSQAFLEFENLKEAQEMCGHFAQSASMFGGKKIFVQYSNHQQLNTDPTNNNNLVAQSALNEAVLLHTAGKQGGKNTVLRVTIQNMAYPVTVDVIHQIFSKFGHVLKVITFTKNDKFQVLIQMKDSSAAQNSRMSLNGQNIYNGCCTLQVDFSKLTNLEVRFNNEKSRDYTNLFLPTGNDGQNNGQGGENSSGNSGGGPMFQQQQTGLIGAAPGMYGNMGGVSANPYMNSNGNMPGMNQPGHHHHSQNSNGMNGPGGNQMSHSNGGGMNQSHGSNSNLTTPVLLVSNLNEELVTPEALFTLFGVYGDVMRVKILFNKKDSALINFSNVNQAATALSNLDRVKLWNKQIRVFPSKHVTVQMPKDGQPDAGLTKDFSNSPLHRFKKPGSKNFNNIFPPSQTLHLSNIPASVQEQDLRELFGQYGSIRGFKFFQKDRKMALIQMDSVEEALTALIATHNYQLGENMHLRCAFSKANL